MTIKNFQDICCVEVRQARRIRNKFFTQDWDRISISELVAVASSLPLQVQDELLTALNNIFKTIKEVNF